LNFQNIRCGLPLGNGKKQDKNPGFSPHTCSELIRQLKQTAKDNSIRVLSYNNSNGYNPNAHAARVKNLKNLK
jgi:hypothetical protein